MVLYSEVPDEFRDAAGRFLLRGEKAGISNPIIVNNKKYYEIIYTKSFLGIVKRGVAGRVIIDEQGRAVTEKNILKSLVRLFYYYSFFFGSQAERLKSIVKTDAQVKRDSREYGEASMVLGKLAAEGVEGADSVKNVMDNFPGMREQANEVMKMVVERIEEYSGGKGRLTEGVIYEILSLYEKSQAMNFERIKFANTASDCYDVVKKEVASRRRKSKYSINRKNIGPLMRLEEKISFFINILRYYGDKIDYSADRYKKLLGNNDNNNIERCFKQIRS